MISLYDIILKPGIQAPGSSEKNKGSKGVFNVIDPVGIPLSFFSQVHKRCWIPGDLDSLSLKNTKAIVKELTPV
jgi:hypothetical protein